MTLEHGRFVRGADAAGGLDGRRSATARTPSSPTPGRSQPGASALVYADVTVPAGYAAGTVSLYFRAASLGLGRGRRHPRRGRRPDRAQPAAHPQQLGPGDPGRHRGLHAPAHQHRQRRRRRRRGLVHVRRGRRQPGGLEHGAVLRREQLRRLRRGRRAVQRPDVRRRPGSGSERARLRAGLRPGRRGARPGQHHDRDRDDGQRGLRHRRAGPGARRST